MRATRPAAPIVRVEANESFPGSLVVHVVCPYCAGIHVHSAELGRRVPHCHPARSDYVVTDPDGLLGVGAIRRRRR